MGKEATEGQLAATIREAVRLRSVMREQGATEEELAAMLEKTVRATWPFTREWHYLCDSCDDTGLILKECPKLPCGRQNPHLPHSYGEPCHCKNGLKFKGKQSDTGTEFTESTRGRKPGRFGR
jgi:hypothetical protein